MNLSVLSLTGVDTKSNMTDKLRPYAAVAILRFKDEDGHSSTVIQPLPLLARDDAHAVEIGKAAAQIMAPSAYQVDIGAVAFPDQLLEQIKNLYETSDKNQTSDEERIEGLPTGETTDEIRGDEDQEVSAIEVPSQ